MNSVLIKTDRKYQVDPEAVQKVVDLWLCQHKLDTQVSIAFVEKKVIRDLNRKYRNLDKATSVLSFFQGQAIPNGGMILGDIVICPQIAEEQNLKIPFLIKHGLKSLLSQVPSAENLRVGLNGRQRRPRKSS